MSGLVNIGAENADDGFYRYKMPQLVAKVEGRGNGIRTNVVNNGEIAKALSRPPEYVLKYFGCELGAQTRFEKDMGTSIVNGAHTQKVLSDLLEGFIKKFVQCYTCGNPETVMKVRKDFVTLKCKACGAKSEVDPRLKLNTFILKNPPEEKISKSEKKVKEDMESKVGDLLEATTPKKEKGKDKDKDKKKDRKDRSSKSKKSEAEEGPGDAANGEGAAAEGEGAGAEGAPAEANGAAGSEDSADEEFSVDTSAEAAAERARRQLTGAAAALVSGDLAKQVVQGVRREAEQEAEERARREREVAELCEQLRGSLSLEDAAAKLRQVLPFKRPLEVQEIVVGMAVPNGKVGRMFALFDAVFTGPGGADPGVRLDKLAEKFKAYLKACAPDEAYQAAQLIALERLCGLSLPARVKEVALVMKVLYEYDIVGDETFEQWEGSGDIVRKFKIPAEASMLVRTAAEPFMAMLAESSSEEDED